MKKSISLFLFIISTHFLDANSTIKINPVNPIGTVFFRENKGQIHDEFYKSKPEVLYTSYAGPLMMHIKANGISYRSEEHTSELQSH